MTFLVNRQTCLRILVMSLHVRFNNPLHPAGKKLHFLPSAELSCYASGAHIGTY